MTVQEYKAALSIVEAEVVPSHPPQDPETALGDFELSNKYGRLPKSALFVSAALRTVVQEKIPIANWDNNDYTHLAILAKSLHAGSIQLSDLVHQPDSLLLKKQVLVGAAILAYIKHMDEKIADDEDEEVDWANDCTLLHSALDLDSFPSLRGDDENSSSEIKLQE